MGQAEFEFEQNRVTNTLGGRKKLVGIIDTVMKITEEIRNLCSFLFII